MRRRSNWWPPSPSPLGALESAFLFDKINGCRAPTAFAAAHGVGRDSISSLGWKANLGAVVEATIMYGVTSTSALCARMANMMCAYHVKAPRHSKQASRLVPLE